MRKILFFLLTLVIDYPAFSQYWQQRVNYTIDVTLNDKDKTLDAFEKLTYINNSPDTLKFIWFHLWPNAYKNDRTAFSDQLLENGSTKFYFSGKDEKGYINRLDFRVNNIPAQTEDHPLYIDVIKLILPTPLPPHQQLQITTPFHVKLPFNISRGGYAGESFQVTQWYPKPAVYDARGWHPMPYLDQGEFYSEFGSFDVHITVPQNYVVAGTGRLQTPSEEQWLRSRTFNSWGKEYLSMYGKPQIAKGKHTQAKKIKDSLLTEFPQSDDKTKTIHFIQDSVHDFAWFADKRFVTDQDTCQLPSGKIILVSSYYTVKEYEYWKNSVQYAKDALRFYSRNIGEYPYSAASIVQGPESFGGGMEYPTITIISPMQNAKDLDETIAHELGHNWFYGIIATNERINPWMDEGMNSFYEYKYVENKYGVQSKDKELLFQTIAKAYRDQPIATSSEAFSVLNYDLVAYHKTAEWMKYLEENTGPELFDTLMHDYYNTWAFKHPCPDDFKNILKEYLGNKGDSIFSLIYTKGILPGHQLKGHKVITLFNIEALTSFLQKPVKDILLITPSLGINSYDKIMLGALITNFNLPPSRFQFLAVPMYGTGSKKFTGIGKLNYTINSDKRISRTDFFLNGEDFSMDQFIDSSGNKWTMKFQKLVPGIRLTLKNKSPRSTATKYIQWKTYLISEQALNSTSDTLVNNTDTAVRYHYTTPSQNRYLNQLQFYVENYRALYPYDVKFQVEQSTDFIRAAVTSNYFFNYSKEGGLEVRFFAGKFFYLGIKTLQKEFSNDRYFLNMTGPNGYEDYTYSDYFIGRNKYDGLASQQIMIKDGGFKVRTDLLANKVGKTDNWLSAVNLVTTIPKNINPLSILPVKIPLRLFLDIGTYAEAWDAGQNKDRFLYDMGFQIPLFDELINIYIPVLYSKVYRDYFKSTIPDKRFLKTISFNINLYNKDVRKINQLLQY